MLTFVKNFLGINEIPDDAQKLILKYFPIYCLFAFVVGLCNSFIILAFIDQFGFGIASFLMAVAFASQFVTDYPTGSLADYIGQRFVIALALVFFSIGSLLISFNNSFSTFFVAAIAIGIGLGQRSGSFESYLDNNYKLTMGKLDQDRKIYGFMYQRIVTIGALCMAISFIIGGIISTKFTRSIAFEIQGILFISLVPIIIMYLTDAKVDHLAIELPKKHNYFYHFRGGFSFLFSSKKTLFLFIGLATYIALTGVWGSLILFPLYFGYTGSDAGVGMLRSSIFIIGSFVIITLARFHKKISNKNLGIIGLVYSTSFFFSAFLIFTFIPMTNAVNILGIICIIVMMTYSVNGIGSFFMALYQRVLSVTVPSDKRNSVYSLLPSIGLILQIPLLPIVGQVIELYGLASGVAILLLLSFVGTGFIFLFHYYDHLEAEQSSIDSVPINTANPYPTD